MGEKIENNIDHEIYQKSLRLLNGFDKDYLDRIRTGNTITYGESQQAKYYRELVEKYSSIPHDARKLYCQALMLSSELKNPKDSTKREHREWTIAPHVIANCDCIVGCTMQREKEIPMYNIKHDDFER